MNDSQRSVIQQHFKKLAADIMMTEDLYGALFQTKIFERNMIDIIKVEKTPQDQVYKMLTMLTKRGPDAFDLFIDIIREDYPWLSETLETSYKSCESLSRQNSLMTVICTCGSAKIENGTESQSQTKQSSNEVAAEGDIKTKVGQFIHKQFGHSKRISQSDKKNMERWLSEQLQQERKRKLKEQITISTDDCLPDVSVETQVDLLIIQPDPVQDKLNQVFNKVKDENQSDDRDEVQTDTRKYKGIDEVDGNEKMKTEEVTNMLDMEIDKLINRLNELESQITQCHYILGDHGSKYSLPDLVKDALFMKKQYECELAKETANSKKIVSEMYDYSVSINKLENTRKSLRQQLDISESEINLLKSEKNVLTERCRVLETERLQHLEKEKTIENLRKAIQELKQPKVDENANFKSTYSQPRTLYRRPGRAQARRGSLDQGIPNGALPFKKNVTKQTVNPSRRKQTLKY